MIEQSLAQPAHPNTRESRGLAIWREQRTEIRFERGVWLVPSQNEATSVYEVTLGRNESCECRDHGARKVACKHIAAATIARAKTKKCSSCSCRFPNADTVEVGPEMEALGHGVGEGERYCRPCAAAVGVL